MSFNGFLNTACAACTPRLKQNKDSITKSCEIGVLFSKFQHHLYVFSTYPCLLLLHMLISFYWHYLLVVLPWGLWMK